jgi:hypothetical protein
MEQLITVLYVLMALKVVGVLTYILLIPGKGKYDEYSVD